jgi:UDP-N-acetyl-D-glucosamine dehydrogenase
MLGVIGLGYVGLPLALLGAKKGIRTVGYDIDKSKIASLEEGNVYVELEYAMDWYNEAKGNFIPTSNPLLLNDCNIKIICVPTPVDEQKKPDFSLLISATKLAAEHLSNNDLVIVESTISPGTMESKVKPILDRTGKEYYLAHCPERIDPGNKLYNVANIPRVVGGKDTTSTKLAAQFYRSIIPQTIMEMSSMKAAEATKITENAFRDINIAFVNEIAKIYDELGIDILEVIEGAKTKPFSYLAHYPGIGVGGHCIPVDPYYLIETAKEMGLDPKLMMTARSINNSMPHHALKMLEEQKDKMGINNPRVALLGIAYKQDVDDDRESPYYEMLQLLKDNDYDVISHDPFFKEKSDYETLDKTLMNADAIIIVTAHTEYRNMKVPDNIRIIVDGRNILSPKEIISRGISYRGIGRR